MHISHYGRICPIETPEGNNIGLISSMGIYAGVDEYGFLTTPYVKVDNRKVITDEVGLPAGRRGNGNRPRPAGRAAGRQDPRRRDPPAGGPCAGPCRTGELAHQRRQATRATSISRRSRPWACRASLIPFLEHDDANRALMGSNMQRQAVPLLRTEPPVVATGMEQVPSSRTAASSSRPARPAR